MASNTLLQTFRTTLHRHIFRIKHESIVRNQFGCQIPTLHSDIKCFYHSTSNSASLSSSSQRHDNNQRITTSRTNDGKIKNPNERKKKTNGSIQLDKRSEVKLQLLEEAKISTEEAKRHRYHHDDDEEKQDNCDKRYYDEWIQQEIKLSDAYSKAIKYTARLRSKDTALKASHMLEEMIRRCGISSKSAFYSLESDVMMDGGGSITIHDEVIDETIHSLRFDTNEIIEIVGVGHDFQQKCNYDLITSIPPPTKQDFNNILHSWGSSKARRKGFYAEMMLWRMMELAIIQPEYFEFPDSRMFALVIKCYAGSTHKLAPQRIEMLLKYHEALASLTGSPLDKDDPYLLMHSIKSIDDFNSGRLQLEKWLERLHSYALNKSNALIDTAKGERIDLTGTYNSILRGFVREGKVEQANGVFHMMQELSNHNNILEMDGITAPTTIDLKTNACNLLLGSCRKRIHLPIAIQLLNQMLDSAKSNTSQSFPLPDEQSFSIVISNLSQMADMNAARSIGEHFMAKYEEELVGKRIDPSTNVHNAFIELLASQYGYKEDLLSMCMEVIDKMSKIGVSCSGIKPDTNTWNAYLKACAANCKDMELRHARLVAAKQIFQEMKTGSKGQLSDKSFQYMMKCTSNCEDNAEREDEIKSLFQMASQMGFVNAEVLQILKQNVPGEEFIRIVGNGRLADNWVKNVTSKMVRYTDFTISGPNKHARRKGKSTSDWAKKQRRREEQRVARKEAKLERRKRKKSLMDKS